MSGGLAVSKALGVENVADHGAVGDGVANDAAAIQAAIDAADVSGNDGALIYLPHATYKVNSTITLPTTIARWSFVGLGVPTLEGSAIAGNSPILTATAKFRGSTIKNLRLLGRTDATIGTVGTDPDGLELVGPESNIYIHNVNATRCGYGFIFTDIHDTRGLAALSGYANDVDVGFLTADCTSLRFYDCNFQNSHRCINKARSWTNVHWLGCVFAAHPDASTTVPMDLVTTTMYDVSFKHCRFEHRDDESLTDKWDSLTIGSSTGGTYPIQNLVIESNHFTGDDVENHIHLTQHTERCVIRHNQFFKDPNNADIKLAAASVDTTTVYGNSWLESRTNTEILTDYAAGATVYGDPGAAQSVTAFAAQDATPSVQGGTLFQTANTSATTITDFDEGATGQEIIVKINDAFTTIDFTASGLKGNGGVDWSPASGDHMRCWYDGTDWLCEVFDNT